MQLFYRDYSFGVLLFALLLAFTMGSMGDHGRPFVADPAQTPHDALLSALIEGASCANIHLRTSKSFAKRLTAV